MRIHRELWYVAALSCAAFLGHAALAAPTAEHKKELGSIQKDVTKAATLVTKKQFEEAEKELDELQKRLDKLVADADFPPTDKVVATLRLTLDKQRQAAAKGLDKPDPTLVSFSKDVAKVLGAKCVGCHNADDPKGKLDLSSFAAMKKGGGSGPIVNGKNPGASSLILRMATPNPAQRMPKGGEALPFEDIAKIAKWISQGSLFDGDGKDEATLLADLGKPKPANAPKKGMPDAPVVINKATGNEKISFVKDIAPSIVNLCIGCHGGNTPRSGLTLTNFEGMMRGGDSGRVVIPGNLDGSRLWQLVGAGEQPRMPMGQLRITRKFHADLKIWIEEGAKYDGPDARVPLRSLVPSDEELLAAKYAKMSTAEFAKFREERTADAWKKVVRDEPKSVETPDFYVFGNASEERLKQVAGWADEQASTLRSIFGVKEKPIFKGRLALFVCKDRFTYSEFNQSVHDRETAPEVTGHAFVTAAYEDALVAVQDVGDEPNSNHPGLKANVLANVTSAYLRRPGSSKLPDWVVQGTGLALAAKGAGPNSYIDSMPKAAAGALEGIQSPDEIFQDGKFGPAAIGPIGYTLVDFLLKNGGPAKFSQFIGKLQTGGKLAESVQAVYAANLQTLGTAYGQQVMSKKGAVKPGKK